ncbi:MAG TPA: hypothetical protein VFX28_16530 [Methylomirabilota bacterium]|nr:hypothetical protein [Methylomirabilota bacterium]
MSRRARALAAVAAVALLAAAVPAAAQREDRTPRHTLFIGIDTSGSFYRAGYEDALAFVAHYIYGHLHGLGGLAATRDLFVAAIGGRDASEPKAFHPIHDFAGKDIKRIEADLREWFPPTDTLTDFNAFFRQVARITKERNLLLTPITVLVISDGIPDVPSATVKPGSPQAYEQIDVGGLEYLARRVTVRLAYPTPTVAESWRKLVPRQRVRLWTVEQEVMRGWRAQLTPEAEPAAQGRLWRWVRENVDYRVRRGL